MLVLHRKVDSEDHITIHLLVCNLNLYDEFCGLKTLILIFMTPS